MFCKFKYEDVSYDINRVIRGLWSRYIVYNMELSKIN